MNGETPFQIKDLLKRLIDVYVPKAAVGAEGNQDAWPAVAVEQVDECYSTEMQVLKREMSKIRVRKQTKKQGKNFLNFMEGSPDRKTSTFLNSILHLLFRNQI